MRRLSETRLLLAVGCAVTLCSSVTSAAAAEEPEGAPRRWVPVAEGSHTAPTPDSSARPTTSKRAAPVKDGVKPGQRPPGFSLTDLFGRVQNPRMLRNRILVLHFWASWCPHCRDEIPELQAIQQRWKPGDVAIITISRDEHLATLRRFVREQRIAYPVIADAENHGAVGALYDLDGVPHTFIIGRDGRILEHIIGAGELMQAVEHALGQS